MVEKNTTENFNEINFNTLLDDQKEKSARSNSNKSKVSEKRVIKEFINSSILLKEKEKLDLQQNLIGKEEDNDNFNYKIDMSDFNKKFENAELLTNDFEVKIDKELSFEEIDFKLIDNIDLIRDIIKRGSSKNNLDLSHLKIGFYSKLNDDLKNLKNLDLKTLLKHQNPLYDSLIFLSKNNRKFIKTYVIHTDLPENSFTIKEVSMAMFCQYFFLYTRGHSLSADEKMPAFLLKWLPKRYTALELKNMLYTGNLDHFNNEWIKQILIQEFPKEVQTRLSLGAAGFRLLRAVAQTPVKDDCSINIKKIVEIVKKTSQSGLYWELHTLTRSNLISEMCVSLNRNLMNLMLLAFSKEQLLRMKQQNLIFIIPEYDPKYEQFLNWNDDTFKILKEKIFA